MSNFIFPFSLGDASLDFAGGKGHNLAALARAGYPVPPGFVVGTGAYRLFVEANRFQARILALVSGVQPDDPASLEAASAEIGALFHRGALPAEIAQAIRSAYHSLRDASQRGSYSSGDSATASGPPSYFPVAVRSSATAEDLPGLAFAGQQDTYLNIAGESALLDAVKRCWASLWAARAMAYRARNRIPASEVDIAVVVQEMVASEVSGVAFTANPVSGRRAEIVIDASYGLGEAIVSGQVEPDSYVVDARLWKITRRKLGSKAVAIVPRGDGEGGTERIERKGGVREQALPDEQIIGLARQAVRIETLFGAPQDIEWALAKGRFYILQSRPITTLYPLPPLPGASERAAHRPADQEESESARVYINFNFIQGVTGPFTPLGIDALRLVFGSVRALLHIKSPVEHFLPDAGGRLFIDFTEPVRDRLLRRAVLAFLSNIDRPAQQTLRQLIAESCFAPKRVLTPGRALLLFRGVLPLLLTVLRALLWPESVRPRVLAVAEQFVSEVERHARSATSLAARLRAMERDMSGAERISIAIMPTVLPAFAAIPLVDRWLTTWLGEEPGAALQLMRGLPGNITIEMNLKLWEAAQRIREEPAALEYMLTQPVDKLVEAYKGHEFPTVAQRSLDRFLEEYGMRGVGEIDLGRPRWRDEPAQVIETLLGYLRLDDPGLAPDVVYRRSAQRAEHLARQYVARTRRTPLGRLRSRLLAGAIRRMRTLGGLREVPLFYLVRVNDIYRTILLDSARVLVSEGRLERAEDIFFVPLAALKGFAKGKEVDLRALAAGKRVDYEREQARRQVPRLVLSTGEAFYEGVGRAGKAGRAGKDGERSEEEVSKIELAGEAVSPGVAEGPARVILDPHGAQLEPGEILVCPSTDPGWTPLFLTAGGLVMEIGGMITHGSVVAREYGIPAVVGVGEATARLKTGQRIRVDGNRGEVIVLESTDRRGQVI